MIEDHHVLHLISLMCLTYLAFQFGGYDNVFNWFVASFIRSNIQEDTPVGSPNTVIKGKVSRAPRTGSVMGLDSSPNIQPSSGTFQDWEQPKGLNKVAVAGVRNNQKRMMSSGSSIHPMTQWVGQRPHKNSRTRRSNLVSPVSNHAEAQISSQSLATTDFSAKTSVVGTSSVDNNNPKIKLELENVSSPFGLSESEESGAGEHKLKEKGIDNVEVALTATHKVVPFVMPTKKNKLLSNESGDGVRRQGRSGRGSSLTRTEIPLVREKLENLSTTKPLQSVKPSSEKNRRLTHHFFFCTIRIEYELNTFIVRNLIVVESTTISWIQ